MSTCYFNEKRIFSLVILHVSSAETKKFGLKRDAARNNSLSAQLVGVGKHNIGDQVFVYKYEHPNRCTRPFVSTIETVRLFTCPHC